MSTNYPNVHGTQTHSQSFPATIRPGVPVVFTLNKRVAFIPPENITEASTSNFPKRITVSLHRIPATRAFTKPVVNGNHSLKEAVLFDKGDTVVAINCGPEFYSPEYRKRTVYFFVHKKNRFIMPPFLCSESLGVLEKFTDMSRMRVSRREVQFSRVLALNGVVAPPSDNVFFQVTLFQNSIPVAFQKGLCDLSQGGKNISPMSLSKKKKETDKGTDSETEGEEATKSHRARKRKKSNDNNSDAELGTKVNETSDPDETGDSGSDTMTKKNNKKETVIQSRANKDDGNDSDSYKALGFKNRHNYKVAKALGLDHIDDNEVDDNDEDDTDYKTRSMSTGKGRIPELRSRSTRSSTADAANHNNDDNENNNADNENETLPKRSRPRRDTRKAKSDDNKKKSSDKSKEDNEKADDKTSDKSIPTEKPGNEVPVLDNNNNEKSQEQDGSANENREPIGTTQESERPAPPVPSTSNYPQQIQDPKIVFIDNTQDPYNEVPSNNFSNTCTYKWRENTHNLPKLIIPTVTADEIEEINEREGIRRLKNAKKDKKKRDRKSSRYYDDDDYEEDDAGEEGEDEGEDDDDGWLSNRCTNSNGLFGHFSMRPNKRGNKPKVSKVQLFLTPSETNFSGRPSKRKEHPNPQKSSNLIGKYDDNFIHLQDIPLIRKYGNQPITGISSTEARVETTNRLLPIYQQPGKSKQNVPQTKARLQPPTIPLPQSLPQADSSFNPPKKRRKQIANVVPNIINNEPTLETVGASNPENRNSSQLRSQDDPSVGTPAATQTNSMPTINLELSPLRESSSFSESESSSCSSLSSSSDGSSGSNSFFSVPSAGSGPNGTTTLNDLFQSLADQYPAAQESANKGSAPVAILVPQALKTPEKMAEISKRLQNVICAMSMLSSPYLLHHLFGQNPISKDSLKVAMNPSHDLTPPPLSPLTPSPPSSPVLRQLNSRPTVLTSRPNTSSRVSFPPQFPPPPPPPIPLYPRQNEGSDKDVLPLQKALFSDIPKTPLGGLLSAGQKYLQELGKILDEKHALIVESITHLHKTMQKSRRHHHSHTPQSQKGQQQARQKDREKEKQKKKKKKHSSRSGTSPMYLNPMSNLQYLNAQTRLNNISSLQYQPTRFVANGPPIQSQHNTSGVPSSSSIPAQYPSHSSPAPPTQGQDMFSVMYETMATPTATTPQDNSGYSQQQIPYSFYPGFFPQYGQNQMQPSLPPPILQQQIQQQQQQARQQRQKRTNITSPASSSPPSSTT